MSREEPSTTPQRDTIERWARKVGFADGDEAVSAFDPTFPGVGWKLSKNQATMVLDAFEDGRLVPKEPEPPVTAPEGGMPADVAVGLLGQVVEIEHVEKNQTTMQVDRIELVGGEPCLVGWLAANSSARRVRSLAGVKSWKPIPRL